VLTERVLGNECLESGDGLVEAVRLHQQLAELLPRLSVLLPQPSHLVRRQPVARRATPQLQCLGEDRTRPVERTLPP
jgi:hypothetical protein